MLRNRFTWLLILVLALGVSAVLADTVSADSHDPESGLGTALGTPKVCDDNIPPKYYCTWIRYAPVANSTNWELRKRLYKGARDGGAIQWQLWYAKDWWWDGSQWNWIRTQTSSAWFTNIIWDIKRVAGSTVTIQQDSAVTMRIRFQECDPSNPSNCWFWCSLITQHNMNGGTSQQYGDGSCFPDGVFAQVSPQ